MGWSSMGGLAIVAARWRLAVHAWLCPVRLHAWAFLSRGLVWAWVWSPIGVGVKPALRSYILPSCICDLPGTPRFLCSVALQGRRAAYPRSLGTLHIVQ